MLDGRESVFVANVRTVAEYATNGQTPQLTIGRGRRPRRELTLDNRGNLIVAYQGGNRIAVYGGRGMRRLQTFSEHGPSALAVDSSNNLYVMSTYHVNEYAPGASLPYATSPFRKIHAGLSNPSSIVVDAAGNLYVANRQNGLGPGISVLVFAPGSRKPDRTITDGISSPISLALDAAGNLYVGNTRGSNKDSVTVYAAGTTTLIDTITEGISGPKSLAFDNSGNLYVANYEQPPYSVTAYAAKTFKLMRTIKSGVDAPFAIAFDKTGNLFVANFFSSSVTRYPPNRNVPSATITQGVSLPTGLAIQP
ncbi:MAG TPA: NHL repeat-containing protein [Candidatus Tumulicola sp.]